MKVKQSILDKINNVDSRRRISEKMSIGDQTLYKHIVANLSDGSLTKMTALKAISEETGIAVDKLLETEKSVA
jgi:hypothetical protein